MRFVATAVPGAQRVVAVAQGFSPAALRAGLICLGVLLGAAASPALADQRYALIVSGASGGPRYAENYDKWRSALVAALRGRLQVRDENLLVLAETPGPGVGRASQAGVRRAVATLRERMTKEAVLLVVLIGHGTFDGVDAKFNLVGPDLEAGEWAELLAGLPGRLVLVNTTSASLPFLEQLAGAGRVVISATDSAAQRFETVFPEFFARAFDEASSDLDKNGRVSIWEAFTVASAGVRQWYEQRGQLATERPVLDDTGDGVGKEAGQPGPDGALARRTYLDAPLLPTAANDPALAALLARRAELEDQVEMLKARKDSMPLEEYEREMEQLLIELAKVSRQIRSRS